MVPGRVAREAAGPAEIPVGPVEDPEEGPEEIPADRAAEVAVVTPEVEIPVAEKKKIRTKIKIRIKKIKKPSRAQSHHDVMAPSRLINYRNPASHKSSTI